MLRAKFSLMGFTPAKAENHSRQECLRKALSLSAITCSDRLSSALLTPLTKPNSLALSLCIENLPSMEEQSS
jgi:hypothetical protein